MIFKIPSNPYHSLTLSLWWFCGCAVLWDSLSLHGRAGTLHSAVSDRAATLLLISFVMCRITNTTSHIAKAANPKTSEQNCTRNFFMEDKGRQVEWTIIRYRKCMWGALKGHIRSKKWSSKSWEWFPSVLWPSPSRSELKEQCCRSTRCPHS